MLNTLAVTQKQIVTLNIFCHLFCILVNKILKTKTESKKILYKGNNFPHISLSFITILIKDKNNIS